MVSAEELQELAGLLHRLADLQQEYAEICELKATEILSELVSTS